MHVWNVLHAARWKYRTQKSPFRHHCTTLSGYIFAAKACIDNRKKNLLNIDTSSTYPHNMVNFGLLTAHICWRVWCTPANFNGFRVLAALLRGTLVLGVSQTLRRSTEGATYIRQGSHHVGHWSTFLVPNVLEVSTANLNWLFAVLYLCIVVSSSGLKCHSGIWTTELWNLVCMLCRRWTSRLRAEEKFIVKAWLTMIQ